MLEIQSRFPKGQEFIDIAMGYDKPRRVTVVGYRACDNIAAGAVRPVVRTEEDYIAMGDVLVEAGHTFTAVPQNLRVA